MLFRSKRKKELVDVVSLKSCSVEWLIFEYVATVVVEELVVAIVAAVAIAVAVVVVVAIT